MNEKSITVNGRNPYDLIKDIQNVEIATTEEVSGKNPPKFNLKEHPEVNGYTLLVLGGEFRESEKYDNKNGFYFIGAALVYPSNVDIKSLTIDERKSYAVTLMTGADNVVTRLYDAYKLGRFPVAGTLRAEGDAWFLD